MPTPNLPFAALFSALSITANLELELVSVEFGVEPVRGLDSVLPPHPYKKITNITTKNLI